MSTSEETVGRSHRFGSGQSRMERGSGVTVFLNHLRIALIDLRGSLARFGILIACLALGVGTIATVGAVGAALQDALNRDARALLGGDIEARLTYRRADADELAFLSGLGKVSEVIDTFARAEHEGSSALAALRGVDNAYPLVGSVAIEGGGPLGDLLASRDGVWGTVVDPVLLERLGIAVGDVIGLGNARFQIRGLLDSTPDQVSQGVAIGFPVVVSIAGLAETGLLDPATLARYRYKMLLNEGITLLDASERIVSAFPDAGWQIGTPEKATDELGEYFENFSSFLAIVGLTALLVGGIGVANAVSAYIADRQRTIATMKALGATRSRILLHFLIQALILIGMGIAAGVTLGALLTLIGLPLLGPAFDLPLSSTIDWPSLGTASVFGLLIGFAFAYGPLHRAEDTKPAILFRTVGTAIPRPASWRDILRPGLVVPLAAAMAGIFGMAVLVAGKVSIVFWYGVGAAVAFAVLALAAEALKAVLRLVRPSSNAYLRNAIKAIVRPGSPAPAIVMSMGLGLALLVLIAILVDDLRRQLDPSIRVDAPTLVYMDLFDDELAELQALAAADPRVERFSSNPVLRTPSILVNGAPLPETDEIARDISIYFGDEYPLTSAVEFPPGNVITAGQWWPPDYAGEPIASVSEFMRNSYGLKLGDKLTFDIFGEPVMVTIASFRDFDWQRGRINFPIILSPGVMDAFPLSYFAFMKVAAGSEPEVERELIGRYPDLVFIPVEEALTALRDVIDGISAAIAVVGTIAVVSGVLVLAGALAAGRRQREADSVVNKVLGATRGEVVRSYLIEYGLVSGLAAALAIGLGVAGAWAFTTLAVKTLFLVDPLLLAIVVGSAVAVTVAIGAATTWKALSAKPARFLREE